MKNSIIKLALIFFLLTTVYSGQGFCGVAPDPVKMSVGARCMGMGKAGVGWADDLNSLYFNPAGISRINRWQITSLQGKLLEDFNYLSLSGVYPTPKYGNFGIGIVNSTIGGAFPTRTIAGVDPNEIVYEIDPTLNTINYYNNVFLLSYGGSAEKVLSLPYINQVSSRLPSWINKIDFGLNFKIFSAGLSGGGLSQASGTGMEMDFGILGSTPYNWLNYGATLQNLLPASLGGKIVFQNKYEDSFPALLKIGAAANILGDEKALRSFNRQKVTLLLDSDIEPTRASNVPILFKLGAEWQPMDLLAVRAGIDQAMAGGSIANNLTAGIGIYYNGFRFDYGYHQYAGAFGIDNHFFSLTYGLFPAVEAKKEYITLFAPLETLITYKPQVNFSGKVHPDIGSAKIKETWLSLSKDGSFEAAVPQAIGKNTVWIKAYDKKGNLLETKHRRILRLINYPDVPSIYWTYEQTNYIGTLGIIKGYPDGTFRPDGNITRAELSTLLVRTKLQGKLPEPARTPIFKDVPVSHWASSYVNFASSTRIVMGYPDKTFKPSSNITRSEGLAMIARFGGITEEVYASVFRDIPASHWAAKIITASQKAGLLQFLRGKPFEPNRPLTRAEAVEILYRTKPIKTLTDDLLNFDKGYETQPATKEAK